MDQYEKLKDYALRSGATRSAIVKTADLKFYNEFRDACEANRCRKYNTTWVCPPACGTIAECISRIQPFEYGLVFQTVGDLEDSFDVEGMELVQKKHRAVFDALHSLVLQDEEIGRILCLNSGSCDLCAKCSYPDEPCRFPDRAVSSVEAYGIFVNGLTEACGLPYYSGPNTMTHTGVIFFREK